MNRAALDIAKSVARKTGTLFAGDICNTNVYDPADQGAQGGSRASSRNRSAGRWKPASITSSPRPFPGRRGADGARSDPEVLEGAGVVTLRSPRGDARGMEPPKRASGWRRQALTSWASTATAAATMMPLLQEVREAVKCHVAGTRRCLTGPPRTALVHVADRSVLRRRARLSRRPRSVHVHARRDRGFRPGGFCALGIRYLGVCCGAGPHHIRALAEGARPPAPASNYSVDMSKHAFFGTDERIKKIQTEYRRQALSPMRYSALALLRGALSGHRNWTPAWRSPSPSRLRRRHRRRRRPRARHRLLSGEKPRHHQRRRARARLARRRQHRPQHHRGALQLPLSPRARGSTTSRCALRGPVAGAELQRHAQPARAGHAGAQPARARSPGALGQCHAHERHRRASC